MHLVEDLGYALDALELEHKVDASVGRGRSGPKWADIAIKKSDGSVWCLLELKIPSKFDEEMTDAWQGQLFGLANFIDPRPQYLGYGTYDLDKGCVKLALADAERFNQHEKWQAEGEPTTEQLSPNYGEPTRPLYTNGGDAGKALISDAGRRELSSLQSSLHNVLWGGGASSDTDIFNQLTRLILAKIHDEKTTAVGDPYAFQIRGNESLDDAVKRIDALFKEAMASRLTTATEQSVIEPGKGKDSQIQFAIEKLSKYNLSDMAASGKGSDIIGDFFERIMRSGFKQTKGQFFTHVNIVDFMVDVVGMGDWAASNAKHGERLPKMIDPSAGSGTFVIRSMMAMAAAVRSEELQASSKDSQSVVSEVRDSNPINLWAADYCVGLELNSDLGLAAQVNMLLHGDGSSAVFAGPKHGDGLAQFAEYPSTCKLLTPQRNSEISNSGYTHPVCERFDAVITNPPFASEITSDDMNRYRGSLLMASHSKKSEDLFCDRWFQLLKPGGRLAAVLPDSVFSGRKSAAREWLLKFFWVRAVVSLPANAFYPHTMTKTSIVFAQRKTHDEVKDSFNASPLDNLKAHKTVHMARAAYLGYKRTSKSEIVIERNDLNDVAAELNGVGLW